MKLKAVGLGVEYGGTPILRSVSLEATGGELIGILGPSGSGKTTLLLALCGFRPAHTGKVILDGRDLYEDFEELKAQIGYVPQDDIVPTALRVERVLQYAAELRLPEASTEAKQARVEQALRKLGLSERRNLRVSKLSGGQRKRVNVGVEILSRPPLLFADEPTSGLDPALERSLTETFRAMADDGAIVVVTTHIMTSLDLYDRLAVVDAGRLAYYGPPEKMKEHFGVDDFVEIYGKLKSSTGS